MVEALKKSAFCGKSLDILQELMGKGVRTKKGVEDEDKEEDCGGEFKKHGMNCLGRVLNLCLN